MIIYLKKILIANFDFVIRLSYQNKIRRKRGYEKKKRYQLIAGATVLSMCVSLVNPVEDVSAVTVQSTKDSLQQLSSVQEL